MAEILVQNSIALYRSLQLHYAARNEDYRILRKQYAGDLAALNKRTSTLSQTQEENLTVYNLVAASSKRFLTQLSSSIPVMKANMRTFDDIGVEEAIKRESWLNFVWRSNRLPVLLGELYWLQSIIGTVPILVKPSNRNISKFEIVSGIPEFFYPMPEDDNWTNFKYVIYAYRKFNGNYDVWLDPTRTSYVDTGHENVLEYWDKNFYQREENGTVVSSVRHGLGFIPWTIIKNIPIPHRLVSESDFYHAVLMHEYINEQLLLQGKIIFDFANAPIAVSAARSSQINFNDRVWDLGPDGRAQFITYPGNSPSQETLFIKSQQGFEDMVGVSSPALGRDIPSGTTGPVISSLLGGFSGILSLKQMMMAYGMYNVNLILQQMATALFSNNLLPIIPSYGFLYSKETKHDIHRVVDPLEWKGYYENSVEFPEDTRIKFAKDQYEISLMNMGLQSKMTTMKKIGIENPQEEIKQILMERQTLTPIDQSQAPKPNANGAPLKSAITPEQQEAIDALKLAGLTPNSVVPETTINGSRKRGRPRKSA